MPTFKNHLSDPHTMRPHPMDSNFLNHGHPPIVSQDFPATNFLDLLGPLISLDDLRISIKALDIIIRNISITSVKKKRS